MTFAPKLQQTGISFEQPVEQPSMLGAIADLGSAFLDAQPKPSKPSAKEVEGAALRPLAKTLEQMRNSNMSPQKYARASRVAIRDFVVANPQYREQALGLGKLHGVAEEVEIMDPQDIAKANIAKWSQETTEGQLAVFRAAEYDSSGQIDMDGTMSNLEVMYREQLAEEAEVAQSKRNMDKVSNDLNAWKSSSEAGISEYIPRWTKKTKDFTKSIVSMALAGDERLDTPAEQLQFLRDFRRGLYNEYQKQAQDAGFHNSVYTGTGEDNINIALKDIDSLISQIENNAQDVQTMAKAYEAANRQNAISQMIDTFGPAGALPAFQEQAFSAVAQEAYQAGLAEFLTGLGAQQAVGGLNLFEKGSNFSQEALEDRIRIAVEDGTTTKEELVKTSSTSVSGVDPSKHESATRTLASNFRMLDATISRLSPDALTRVLNPTAISKVKEVLGKGDELAKYAEDSFVGFAANQVRMNVDFIEANLDASEGYEVKQVGQTLFLFKDGAQIRDSKQLSVGARKGKNLFKAVQNINTINSVGKTVLGVDQQDTPKTVLPRDYKSDNEEIQKYLDQADQVVPADDIKGSQEADPFGAPTAGALINLIDKTEGGGNYDTLFGHSQREGGAWAGTKVSQMTIGELLDFSGARGEGSYGSWVRSKNPKGVLATPMGRYQIVGTTLRQAAKEMGLATNTVFTDSVQDAMFHHLARKRLKGVTSIEGKRKALRAEWNGFKHVSDEELDAAIAVFEGSAPPSYVELQREPGSMLTAPRESIRPQAASPEFRTVRAEAQGEAVSTAQVSPVTEGANATVEGTTEAVRMATEQEVAKLSEGTKEMLKRMEVSPESIPSFGSREEMMQAFENGDVKDGDVVLVEGHLEIV